MNASQTQLQAQAHTDVNSDQHSAVGARLRGRWLVLVRISWLVLAALALIVFVAGLPLYFEDIQSVCNAYSAYCDVGQLHLESAQILQNLGISVGSYAVFTIILTIIIALVWFVVGGLIFWRKSDERVALLVSLGLVLYVSQGGDAYLLTVNNPIWMILVNFVQFLAWVALFLVLFLFPDGHFVPRWMRWFAVGFILILFDAILSNFMPTWPLNPWNLPLSPYFFALMTIYGIGLAIPQIYRYRRISSLVQRRQTKLVFFALSIFLLGFVGQTVVLGNLLPNFFPALMPPDPLNQLITIFVQNLVTLLIPISLGIAMFRYRLWDIDIIINRTLVYTALTGTLVVVYIACILILQALLSGFTSGNSVALVVSTLAIWALFQPFRRRIQNIIDRRFYRRKYDAARTIAAFSATLRGETDLNTLSEQLVAVVQETMQPAHVSLWLKPADREARLHIGKLPTAAVQATPSLPTTETAVAERPEPPPRKISRRALIIGLATGGVVLAGGGLSWWLLRRRAFFTYTGHTDWVYDVAWSPNGKRIASTSKDTTVQIWDAVDGSHVFMYRGHRDEVYTAAWSPDGKRIASCSKDKTVQVWDAADGGHLFTYRGHTDQVFTLAWSPDGKYLASGGPDKTVQIWNAADGDHVFTYTGHTDWVDGVAWSPDSTRIASASSDKTAQVWDAANGGHVFVYNGHTNYVVTTAWSPDGTRIASSSYDNTVQVWSPA